MSERTLGILRVGTSHLAIDIAHLVEVVTLETRPAPGPLAPVWSLGVVSLRGRPTPLVNLSRLLALEAHDASRVSEEAGLPERRPLVALIDYRGARIGLQIEEVATVKKATPDRLHAASTGGERPGLTPHFLELDDPEQTAYVIDIDALFDLEGMMAVQAQGQSTPGKRPEQPHLEATRSGMTRWLIVAGGGTCLALDAAVVQEVVTGVPIEPTNLDLPAYLGDVGLRKVTMPLFDPFSMIGLKPTQLPAGCVIVLTSAQGRLALAVERVVELTGRCESRWRALPPDTGHVAAICGLVAMPENDALALDHERLFASQDVIALTRFHAQVADERVAERVAERGGSHQRFTYFRFDCGTELMTPLEQLEAVDAAPPPAARTESARPGILATWRRLDRTVSLIDLRTLMGVEAATPGQVLIVESGAGLVGFLVNGVQDVFTIEAPATSHSTHWRGDTQPRASALDAAKRLISVGTGASRQVLSLLDLKVLAEHMMTHSEADRDTVMPTTAIPAAGQH